MEYTTIGGDPALRHGVFVIATWDIRRRAKLVDYSILYEWGKKDQLSLSEKSSLGDIQRLCFTIVRGCGAQVPGFGTYPVGIDWTSSTGFMGRRIQASVLSWFIGYLTREFEIHGFPVIIISPAEVREQMGLRNNVPKETVWHELRAMMQPEQVRMKKSHASDLRDALVLSYLVAMGRSRNEAGEGFAANLPVS